MTLIPNQSPNFNPGKIQIGLNQDSRISRKPGIFPVVATTRVKNNRIYLNLASNFSTDSVENLQNLVVSLNQVHVAVRAPQVLASMLYVLRNFSAPTLRGRVGGQTRLLIFYNLKYPLLTQMVIKKPQFLPSPLLNLCLRRPTVP